MSKLNAILEENIKRKLGVSIKELNKSLISSLENRLSSSILLTIYKDAKKAFQKAYFEELLTFNHGNISKAARIANLNRRQIHRICIDAGVEVREIRREMLKPYYYLKQNIEDITEQKINEFRNEIKPERLTKIYKNIPQFSQNIIEFIDEKTQSYEEALETFEKRYFEQVLETAKGNTLKAAEIAGISERSIVRKIKALQITA